MRCYLVHFQQDNTRFPQLPQNCNSTSSLDHRLSRSLKPRLLPSTTSESPPQKHTPKPWHPPSSRARALRSPLNLPLLGACRASSPLSQSCAWTLHSRSPLPFPKLPAELRNLVWEHASPNEASRTIGIDLRNFGRCAQPEAPGILMANKESRAEGLRFYTACKETVNVEDTQVTESQIIYVNFEVDRFCVPLEYITSISPTHTLNFDDTTLQLIKLLSFKARHIEYSLRLAPPLDKWMSLAHLQHIGFLLLVLMAHEFRNDLHRDVLADCMENGLEDTVDEEMQLQNERESWNGVDLAALASSFMQQALESGPDAKVKLSCMWQEYREMDLVPIPAGFQRDSSYARIGGYWWEWESWEEGGLNRSHKNALDLYLGICE
ncbi:uncharacterized protein LY89DRAFT_725192 [Mollisia scopiformis]|uniref:2EXR domain-containing protein n=1 Tax=Mollisia scopiformis TaxID=149040 RepID=A0A132B7A5_MOLSC|nr:uncharacterized protein LY89DRAFT_725192 [Mollisia scopiformis]KUJ08290.1 hypothetical protein LY89DRAFT_725192 [Mollisia scopiformis]